MGFRITGDIIRQAEDYDACEKGLKWGLEVLNQKLTVRNTAPEHILWLARTEVEDLECFDLFEWCVREEPCTAIVYASHLLSPELLDWCAKKQPHAALEYVYHLLSTETLDWCAKKSPWKALSYAGDLLSPEIFEWCVKQNPKDSIKYFKNELSPKLLRWCTKKTIEISVFF